MAWCRPGDKPLSEQMMVSLLTHMCVTRLRWVNQMFCFIGNAVLIIYDNTYIVYAAYVNYFYKSDFNYSFSSYLRKRNGSWYSMARFLWNPLSADIFQAWLHGSWVPASVLQWAETCNAINHYTKKTDHAWGEIVDHQSLVGWEPMILPNMCTYPMCEGTDIGRKTFTAWHVCSAEINRITNASLQHIFESKSHLADSNQLYLCVDAFLPYQI